MNTSLLKSYIVRHNDTQTSLAKYLGISLSTLNAKINGSVDFRQNEIMAIKKCYDLSASEVDRIFFAQ